MADHRHFQQPVTTITMLFFIVCMINIAFKPWFGSLIDRRGEGFAIQFEAVVMFTACTGFIFAKQLSVRRLSSLEYVM